MSEIYSFVFPVPPSVNHYLKNHHRTPEANAYRDECRLIARGRIDAPLEGELVVTLDVPLIGKKGHRRDIDNFSKVIFDALNGLVWHDDSQIIELHVYGKSGKIIVPTIELSVWSKDSAKP